MPYHIGQRCRLSEAGQENENYEEFLDKILIVTHVATNESQHPGYDRGLRGQALYDFKLEDGTPVPFSLYQYELRTA